MVSEECVRLLAGPLGPAVGLFSSCYILDEVGILRGRSPVGVVPTLGRLFEFRDYFRGVQALERSQQRRAYVSRVYRSEGNDEFETAISIALHDSADRWVGVLSVSLPTGATFGSIELDDLGDKGFSAALLAPRSLERGDSDARPGLVFLKRPQLPRGDGVSASPGDVMDSTFGTNGLVRNVPVRGTPYSVLVRVAFDSSGAGGG